MSELRVNATATAGGTDAYRYVDTVYFTSNGTFAKASYPWLRAIRVRVQGAGGGGGGADSPSSPGLQVGMSGCGGAYAESFITDIAGLASSETVTVGSGGSGGAGAANGSSGGDSSFGSLVVADGGDGGTSTAFGTTLATVSGRVQSQSPTGDFIVLGGQAGGAVRLSASQGFANGGGDSFLGTISVTYGSGTGNGVNNDSHGGGGSGCLARNGEGAHTGGRGGDGIVILELYA